MAAVVNRRLDYAVGPGGQGDWAGGGAKLLARARGVGDAAVVPPPFFLFLF
jgi:hypothetical protein